MTSDDREPAVIEPSNDEPAVQPDSTITRAELGLSSVRVVDAQDRKTTPPPDRYRKEFR